MKSATIGMSWERKHLFPSFPALSLCLFFCTLFAAFQPFYQYGSEDVCRFDHPFCSNWNITATTGRIAMKFHCLDDELTHFSNTLTFLLAPGKVDIFFPLRMKCNDDGDPLVFCVGSSDQWFSALVSDPIL